MKNFKQRFQFAEKFSITVLVILCLWGLVSCNATGSINGPMSPEMKVVVEKHRRGEWDLDPIKMKRSERQVLPKTEGKSIELYQMPKRTEREDSFAWRIVLDRSTGRYWIIRSGGFAPKTIVYGPAKLVGGE
jgi:hypothetical protein